ncbi:MAG: hypothetical protein HY898_17060 [Deltaproteobacteria bacterium]|nr:hypothetical protein [Deltaproteobacteria bacterium]
MRMRLAQRGPALLFVACLGVAACAKLIGADEVEYQAPSTGSDASAEAEGSAGSSQGGSAGTSGSAGTGGAAGGTSGAAGEGGPGDAEICDDGLQFCPGAGCVDLATNAKNCGECGKDCVSPKCADAFCQPQALALPLSHQPLLFDADLDGIYWVDGTEYGRMNTDGTQGAVLKDFAPDVPIALEAGPIELFLILQHKADGGTISYRIVKINKTSGLNYTMLLDKLASPSGLARAKGWLYWSSGSPVEGLSRVHFDGTGANTVNPSPMITRPSAWNDIVCYGVGGSDIDCIDPSTDAPMSAVNQVQNLSTIARGGDHVFWISKAGLTEVAGAIWDGSKSPDVMIGGINTAGHLTADADWVYFTEGTSTVRGHRWPNVSDHPVSWAAKATVRDVRSRGALYWTVMDHPTVYKVVR